MPREAVSSITSRLRLTAIARAHFDQQYTMLLDELSVSSLENENRVSAMVGELAERMNFGNDLITDDHAREILRRTAN